MVWPTVQNCGGGHHLALHEAPSGLVLIGQRGLDGGPLDLGHGGQHLGALVGLQVVDDVGGVVALHLPQRLGQDRRGDVLEDLLADLGVELGQHLGQDLGIQVRDQFLAVVGERKPIRSAMSAGCRAPSSSRSRSVSPRSSASATIGT